MGEWRIKQGDLAPPLEAQLLDDDGNPINLQGASVQFCMGRHVRAAATVVNAAEGRVRYDWQPGDTDPVGLWNVEFVVAFASGTVERVPGDGFERVQVVRSLCGSDDE